MRSRRPVLILLAAATFAGCESTWEPATPAHRATKIGVTADLPDGWTRYTPSDKLTLTRDGPLLQAIIVSRESYGSAIEHTDRTIEAGMLPHEAAQIVLDAMAADPEKRNFEVLENGPAEVDGRTAFRVDVRYKREGLPTTRETLYGVLTDEDYLMASYRAADRHYHEQTINDFESTIASMRIDPPREVARSEAEPSD